MMKKHRRSEPNEAEEQVISNETPSGLPDNSLLIEEIKQTADKLAADGATRGDLKILSRALRELRYAFKVFKEYRRRRKVSVFGSARTPEHHPVYQEAVAFGRRLVEEGWMVLTGAGPGVMEAANVGAGREMSMGVNIMLPFEQYANKVLEGDEKLVHLKYFFTRKLLFVKEVHAIALFPGGFGTQDEAFETMTLVQTGKRDLMPIVMVDQPGGTYWKRWQEFIEVELLQEGLISPADMSLFKITSHLDEAVEEIMGFYAVYHSMRYVKGQLVIRLHVDPDDQMLQRLNDEFGDIIVSGRIEKVEPHSYEGDDEHLMKLPRLGLNFDRKNLGRLRQMVDLLNEELGSDDGSAAE